MEHTFSWHRFNAENWQRAEDIARTLATERKLYNYSVTGTHGVTTLTNMGNKRICLHDELRVVPVPIVLPSCHQIRRRRE